MQFRCAADQWFHGLRKSDQEVFTEARRRLFDDMVDKVLQMQGPAPSTLFHYTDVFGLSGILNSRVLYCTNISTMNDPTEIAFAKQIATPLIKARMQAYSTSSTPYKVLRYATKRLGEIGDPEPIRTFVSCFSALADDLGQWTRYGRGRGISIEFGTEEIIKAVVANKFYLVKCLYRPDEHKALVNNLASMAVGEYNRLLPLARNDDDKFLYREAIMYALAPFLALLKSSKWEFDNEWRILYYSAPGEEMTVDMIVAPKFLKRKVNLGFDQIGFTNSIRSVTLMDSEHARLNRQSVEAALDSRGMHVPVKISEAPLREY